MSEYLELPWSVEDTINNLKELKDGLQKRCIIQNLHGRGEKDAEEIAFDFDRAIKALEEVEQYRAIGTPEECRQAAEKQKAKKPSEQSCEEKTLFKCSNCGYIMKIKYSDGHVFGHSPNYCEQCGQKMDWGDKR